MSVHNDWAPLEEIIVGTAKGYRIPPLSRSFVKSQFPEYNEDDIPVGSYPDWVIEEAEEDLEILSETLRSLDIVVHRPDLTYADLHDNWHYYSPRDCTLIVGDTIIETPSPIINRQYGDIERYSTTYMRADISGSKHQLLYCLMTVLRKTQEECHLLTTMKFYSRLQTVFV